MLERNGDSSYYINNLHVRRRGRHRPVPRHRAGAARLRHHRAGHDLAHHRGQAGGPAPVPGRGGGHHQVQGAAARDREPPGRHPGKPVAGGGHPQRAGDPDRPSRSAGRGGPAATMRLQAELAERQHLLWLLKRNDARSERERAAREVERATNRARGRDRQPARTGAADGGRRAASTYAAGDALHAAQDEMFAANAEVARLEQELRPSARGAAAARKPGSPSWRASEAHWQRTVRHAGTGPRAAGAELQENARNARRAGAALRHRGGGGAAAGNRADAAAGGRAPPRPCGASWPRPSSSCASRRPIAPAPSAPSKPWRSGARGSIRTGRIWSRRIPHAIDRLRCAGWKALSRAPAAQQAEAGGAAVRAAAARAGASHGHRTGTRRRRSSSPRRGRDATRWCSCRAGCGRTASSATGCKRHGLDGAGAAVAGHRGRARLGDGAGGGAARAAGRRRARR
ncbi:MAG: hypothetical protein MZW92_78305 [Comamonadaceae bacterium]|nr:hypothetical protein [Comamonadaceae bacterium]